MYVVPHKRLIFKLSFIILEYSKSKNTTSTVQQRQQKKRQEFEILRGLQGPLLHRVSLYFFDQSVLTQAFQNSVSPQIVYFKWVPTWERKSCTCSNFFSQQSTVAHCDLK